MKAETQIVARVHGVTHKQFQRLCRTLGKNSLEQLKLLQEMWIETILADNKSEYERLIKFEETIRSSIKDKILKLQ